MHFQKFQCDYSFSIPLLPPATITHTIWTKRKKTKKKHIAPPIYYIQQSGQTQELTFPTFANLSRCCFCTVISSVYKYMKNGRATQGGSILGLIEVVCFFELSLTSLAASSVEVKYCRNTRLRAARMT